MVNKPSIVDIIEAGLRANSVRQRVVANNLANVNTPGFRRTKVHFEDALAEALDSTMGISKATLMDMEAELFKPYDTPVDARGNDVDLDVEIGELVKTAGRQKALLKFLKKQYEQMEAAMK
ncbi:MAG: flagellar basal body rod protein FlgB [Planctomycetes bacterium]|jgi:flagellar basal-body rod protein FlgB|nr:flagellar basal body rod protein FlgB [Phycisphaerae bacterium]NBB95052.1 flagellar basal body rod protein FlgB [Planctomycetota bacterium]